MKQDKSITKKNFESLLAFQFRTRPSIMTINHAKVLHWKYSNCRKLCRGPFKNQLRLLALVRFVHKDCIGAIDATHSCPTLFKLSGLRNSAGRQWSPIWLYVGKILVLITKFRFFSAKCFQKYFFKKKYSVWSPLICIFVSSTWPPEHL